MEILFVHTATEPAIQEWYASVAGAARLPLRVTCFSLTMPGLKRKLHWDELHLAWRTRHPALMRRYRELQKAAEGVDVLLLNNGWNLHPEFLPALPSFNVFCCFDDPESSRFLSRPVAAAFDAVFYGNVASALQYEQWGCRKMAHLPIFTAPGDVPSPQQRGRVQLQGRDNDIVICCGKSKWRRGRLSRLAQAFPQARCIGAGWPGDFVPQADLLDCYGRSKIGWNIHNTTGPINQRLFALAAWNILQICDNKTGLAEYFELGREVIGFDRIDEAIEATHYYLAHEQERCAIATRAYERYWREYHPAAIWERIRRQVVAWRGGGGDRSADDLDLSGRSLLRHRVLGIPQRCARKTHDLGRSLLKRFGGGAWPVDERFYLGDDVPYRVSVTPWVSRWRAHSEGQDAVSPLIQGRALCWAATALIGSETCLRVWDGEWAQIFLSYASRDPKRDTTLLKGPNAGLVPVSRGGLTVSFITDSIVPGERLDRELSCREVSSRSVWAFGPPAVEQLGGTDQVHQKLSGCFRTVRLYWLPNGIVPWLEPLTGPLKNVSVLAECEQGL